MKKIIIIPGCSDFNRGDQALVWETKKIAEEIGYKGKFYMVSEKNEPVKQSLKEGFDILEPILEHPSRKFKNKKNIQYTIQLKIKWGIVAIWDLIFSLLILCNFTRRIFRKFLGEKKKNTLKAFENADAIFMKGGGLLQTYGGISSTYSMYFWLYPIFLANKLKKNVYIMPNSFGPFKGPFVRQIAKKALNKCKIITTREKISQEVLKKELGISAKNYADLAFNLDKAEIDKKMFFEKFNISTNKKKVAITIRPYRFPMSKNPVEEYEKFKKEIALFIKWLYNNDFIPVMIEHTLAINSHENDGRCIDEVSKLLDKEETYVIKDDSLNCRELKQVYSYFDYVVGTRFHSMIFSFGSNIPGIAISYTGNKTIGIMKDMGLSEYVVDIYDVESNVLSEKFSELVRNEKIVKNKIIKYREKAELDRKNLIKECREII